MRGYAGGVGGGVNVTWALWPGQGTIASRSGLLGHYQRGDRQRERQREQYKKIVFRFHVYLILYSFNQDFPVNSLPMTSTNNKETGKCGSVTRHPSELKQNLNRSAWTTGTTDSPAQFFRILVGLPTP
jgi:hypothetical protein